MELSDADLLAKARQGDHDAFALLVRRHRPRVSRVVALYLVDRSGVDDVVQDVMVRLYRGLPTFRGDAEVSTWLHRVAVNACIDVERSRRRRAREVPLDSPGAPVVADCAPPVDAALVHAASDRAVRTAISKLPDELRTLVVLRFGASLTHAELAETLSLPLGTVCTRMQRALKRLAVDLSANVTEWSR